MGAKTIILYWGLCFITAVIQIISCSVRWHSTRVMIMIKTLFRMQSGLLHVKVDQGVNLLCGLVNKIQGEGFCKELADGTDLQSASQSWCAPTIMRITAAPCEAFSAAYLTGVAVLIVIVINICLLAVSSFLMYQYLEGTYKQRYRLYAMGMHSIGSVITLVVIIVYGVYTMQRLDGIAHAGIPGFAQATAAPGLSAGYILISVSWVVQLVGLALFPLMAKSTEFTEKDRILAKENADTDELIEKYGAMSNQRAQGPGDSSWDFTPPPPVVSSQSFQPMPQPMAQSMPPEGTPSRPAW